MATKLTYGSLRKFDLDGGILDMNGESRVIFLVRRVELEDLRGAYVEPVLADVAMRLMTKINELQWLKRIDLYHSFTSVDHSRVRPSLVHKPLGHTVLQEVVTLTLRPMTTKTHAQTHFHWKVQGEEQTSNSMDLDNSEVTYPFRPMLQSYTRACRHQSSLTGCNQVRHDFFFQLDLDLGNWTTFLHEHLDPSRYVLSSPICSFQAERHHTSAL